MLKEERTTITYKEFEKEIEAFGYDVVFEDGFAYVSVVFSGLIARVSMVDEYNFEIFGERFTNINPGEAIGKMFYLAHLLSQTPLEDRVEREKKYYWKIKGGTMFEFSGYLSGNSYGYFMRYKPSIAEDAVTYTQKEYDELVEKGFIADIFEKEEII